jgi:hypothetical protein
MTWPTLTDEQTVALAKLRAPFPPEAISKLPKGKEDKSKRAKCRVCHGSHDPSMFHLDYVGHAALTDRLLTVDLEWTWAPYATDPHGAPLLERDSNGNPVGLWIRLHVAGMARPGYGSVESGKPDAVKELIGDALRNAGMRFGMALELWHKGDLPHEDEPAAPVDLAPLDALVREAQAAGVEGDYQTLRAWAAKSVANRDAAEHKLRKMLSDTSGAGDGDAAASEDQPPAGNPRPVPAGSGEGSPATVPLPSPSPDPSHPDGWDVPEQKPDKPVPFDWRGYAKAKGLGEVKAWSAVQKALKVGDTNVRNRSELDTLLAAEPDMAAVVKGTIDDKAGEAA